MTLKRKAIAAVKKIALSGGHSRELPTVYGIDYSEGFTARVNAIPKWDVRYSDAKRVCLKRVTANAGTPRQKLGSERVESLLSDFSFGPQLDHPDVHRLHRDYPVDTGSLKQTLQRFCG